jgi:polyisoprenoid-binding protein YceI
MKLVALLLCLLIVSRATGQNYTPVDDGSTVAFSIGDHFLGRHTVKGTFRELKGTIRFTPQSLESEHFDVTVNVGTLHTGIGKRDLDLKKEQYFNLDKYATIRIKSTHVSKGSGANQYILDGNLTIKGTTHPVKIPFTATKTAAGDYLFTGGFNMNRLDYNVGDAKSKIDNELTVALTVHAKKS